MVAARVSSVEAEEREVERHEEEEAWPKLEAVVGLISMLILNGSYSSLVDELPTEKLASGLCWRPSRFVGDGELAAALSQRARSRQQAHLSAATCGQLGELAALGASLPSLVCARRQSIKVARRTSEIRRPKLELSFGGHVRSGQFFVVV